MTVDELRLLKEVLTAQDIRDAQSLMEATQHGSLTRAQRDRICDAINAEFSSTGLTIDDEPNARGLALEKLLDEINRPNIGTD